MIEYNDTMSSPGAPTTVQLQSSCPTPQQTAEARAAFLASLNSTGSTVSAALQTRAQDIHSNTAAITDQEKQVKIATEALGKESKKYEKVVEDGAKKLKELGDVQNWAEMLERDLLMLEETMSIVDEEEEQRRDDIGADSNGKHKGSSNWF